MASYFLKVNSNFKGLDHLINNAGITRDNLSLRMSSKEWNEVLDLNLTSTFLLCKFTLKK